MTDKDKEVFEALGQAFGDGKVVLISATDETTKSTVAVIALMDEATETVFPVATLLPTAPQKYRKAVDKLKPRHTRRKKSDLVELPAQDGLAAIVPFNKNNQ